MQKNSIKTKNNKLHFKKANYVNTFAAAKKRIKECNY